jgi:transcriptional regulator with XRE-family HTH domain
MSLELPPDNGREPVQDMARKKLKAPPDLADQLRQAITGCGLSLNQLARATGVHVAQLSRFVRKERSLQLTAAAKLCTYLGLRLTGPALDVEE